jgi:hypothetical protein
MRRTPFARHLGCLVGASALFIALPAFAAPARHHKPKAATPKDDAAAPKPEDDAATKPSEPEAPPEPKPAVEAEAPAPGPPPAPAETARSAAPELEPKAQPKPEDSPSNAEDDALGRRERLRLAAGRSEVAVSLSAGVASRHFTYSDPVGRLLRPYKLPAAPMASFGLEAYPLATTNVPVLRDLGFAGRISRAIAVDSKTPEGAKLETSWTRFGGELRERLLVPGPHAFEAGLFAGADASYFLMSTTTKIAALLPSARSISLRFGFDARVLVAGRLSLMLGGAYLDTTSPGEIYERFRRPHVAGVEGAFGCAVELTPGFEAQLTGEYTRYFASFKPAVGDAAVAGGALDQQLQFGLGVRYAH